MRNVDGKFVKVKRVLLKILGGYEGRIITAYEKRYRPDRADLREENHITDRDMPIYLILRRTGFSGRCCGMMANLCFFLAQLIFYEKNNYIPVVDMKNYPSTMLDDNEVGMRNAWTKFFEQPGGYRSKKHMIARTICYQEESSE